MATTVPQVMKIPASKQQKPVDKEWEKLEKIPAWDLTKVRSKSVAIDEGRKSFFLPHRWTSVISECRFGSNATKIQKVELHSEAIL